MINRTNNAVFAYKANIPSTYDATYFSKNFAPKMLIKNIYKHKDSDYYGALIFEGEEDEGLFFKFSKIRDKDFLITDLQTALQTPSGLGKLKKYTNNSFFVYYPKKNIILGLYNDEAMKHIIAPLTRYFTEFIREKDIKFEMIKIPVDIDKILPNAKYINRIEIHTALQNIDWNAQKKKLNPFRALEDYSNEGDVVQYFPYLRSYPLKSIKKILVGILKTTKAEHIWVETNNMNFDILGSIMLHFPCNVAVDTDDLPIFSDFKTKVKAAYEKHKNDLLANY